MLKENKLALQAEKNVIKERLIQIQGHIIVQAHLSHDEVWQEFIRFVEQQGWQYIGYTDDVTETEEKEADCCDGTL